MGSQRESSNQTGTRHLFSLLKTWRSYILVIVKAPGLLKDKEKILGLFPGWELILKEEMLLGSGGLQKKTLLLCKRPPDSISSIVNMEPGLIPQRNLVKR